MAYEDIAVAWINQDKNGGSYLTVTLKKDMKEGEKLFLRKNTFKKPGDKSPDYRYSIKVEDRTTEDFDSDEVSNGVPF